MDGKSSAGIPTNPPAQYLLSLRFTNLWMFSLSCLGTVLTRIKRVSITILKFLQHNENGRGPAASRHAHCERQKFILIFSEIRPSPLQKD